MKRRNVMAILTMLDAIRIEIRAAASMSSDREKQRGFADKEARSAYDHWLLTVEDDDF